MKFIKTKRTFFCRCRECGMGAKGRSIQEAWDKIFHDRVRHEAPDVVEVDEAERRGLVLIRE